MIYIKPEKAFAKLKNAETDFSPVMVTAPTGFGKTAFVHNYYKYRTICYLSGAGGKLEEMPDASCIRKNVIVIDDLSMVHDISSREYIISLLKTAGIHVILLSRSELPSWLLPVSFSVEFTYITEHDLSPSDNVIKKIFHDSNLQITDTDMEHILVLSKGYPIALKLFMRHIKHGDNLSETLVAKVLDELYHYFDAEVFGKWPPEIQRFLLATCPYPEIPFKLAEKLLPDVNLPMTIETARQIGSFLAFKNVSTYVCRDELRYFLRWKRDMLYSKEQNLNNYIAAGDYYYETDDPVSSLYYYKKGDSKKKMQQVLIDNAKRHPGIGRYYELKAYYEELPDAMILESPVLMMCVSFMYSITLRPDESEKWFHELECYEQNASNPTTKRNEAKAYKAYLDFNLPHRKRSGLEHMIKGISDLVASNKIAALPESSITGNQPTVMNGGLDVCEWSKKDNMIAKMLALPFSKVLGKGAQGLINTGLAESGFEKNTMNSGKIQTLLNSAYAKADHAGNLKMCFAAEGVLIKHYVTEGNIRLAEDSFRIFRQKIIEENAGYLMDNVEALGVRLELFTGNISAVNSWLKDSPDEKKDFCTLHRYIYMTKLRCLMATEQYEKALSLSNYLETYIVRYNRTYLKIENCILRAIILYRMNNDDWKSVFEEAVIWAQEYHFVWVIAIHGGAVTELLTSFADIPSDISPDFINELTVTARKMALQYPNYMNYVPQKTIRFTHKEEIILGLLCEGKTTGDICDICQISYSGLKKHNRNIYAKLNVKNRAEAERVASRLGLVHR